MVKSAKPKTAYKPYKTTKSTKSARKGRQKPSGVTDRCTALQRQEIEQDLIEMNKAGKSWRWIAKHTIGTKRYGWIGRVASGKQDVKPTKTDVLLIRRLYDTWRSEKDITEERLEKLLRLNEIMAEFNQIVVWMMRQE